MRHLESTALKKRIANYLQQGYSIRQAMQHFETSRYMVKDAIERFNIDHKYHTARVKNINFKMIGLIINTEKSYTEISQELDVSRQCVSQMAIRLQDVGIKFHERRSS